MTRYPRLLRLLCLWDRAWWWRRCPLPDPLPAFYERVWSEAALALGASLRPLGGDAYEIVLDKACTRVHAAATPLDDLATHRIVRYKAAAYRLLAQHGLPTPRHTPFHLADLRPALDFLSRCGGPCVVKPADGAGGGRGITTGVDGRWQLARAACAAARHGSDLLLEEQVSGDNYRLLYLDGELLDAVLRRPPGLVGDGRSSVRRLVEAANAARAAPGPGMAHAPLTVDLEMVAVLAGQGYTLRSVPAVGQAVRLKSVTNEGSSAESVPAAPLLCPALVAEGARAAAALGVRLAGVDLLAPDPGVPLHASGGVILEVNTCPGLFWHYHRQGPPAPVCIPILRRLLEESSSSR